MRFSQNLRFWERALEGTEADEAVRAKERRVTREALRKCIVGGVFGFGGWVCLRGSFGCWVS